ncbi:MAG: KH domain-containing protein [Actinobacteria bacterium]|nr:KH domain-containing protein [Actinomycetota bacterium]
MLDISGTLDKIFEEMGINAKVKSINSVDKDNLMFVNIDGEDMGLIIGNRGQTLNALQLIINIIFGKNPEERKQVILDVDEYKQKKRQKLEDLAEKMAKEAVEKNKPVVLRPMSSFERKIIHLTLQNNEAVETISSGEEPFRKVSIIPKNM